MCLMCMFEIFKNTHKYYELSNFIQTGLHMMRFFECNDNEKYLSCCIDSPALYACNDDRRKCARTFGILCTAAAHFNTFNGQRDAQS